MRRRLYPEEVKPKASVQVIRVKEPTGLVTLDDPDAGTEQARGAFVRIRPPEGLTEDQIDSWRRSAAKVARAVKVLPAPKAAEVPVASHRPDTSAVKVGSIRVEAMKLARETENKGVLALTKRILDEVGVR